MLGWIFIAIIVIIAVVQLGAFLVLIGSAIWDALKGVTHEQN